MLVIRREQVAALSAAQDERLREWLLQHAVLCFPRLCAPLGEVGLRALVEKACVTAEEEGFQSPRGASCFLDLMLVLGPGFVDSSEHPWARPLLRDIAGLSEPKRIEVLFQAARAWLKRAPLPTDEEAKGGETGHVPSG